MKEFNEKRYLYLERLADFLDYGNLAEYSDVSELLSSEKWKNCIAPFFGLDDLVLRDRYEVKSNRESGYGRYDVMLIPRETLDQAIIKKEEATSKSLLPFFVLLQNFKIHHCFFQNFFMCIFHLCQRCSKSSNFFSHHVKSSLNRDRVHFTEESINQWKCI